MDDTEYAQDPPIKTGPVGDRGERYPEPVANFEAWFGARCREAATASNRFEIDAAVAMVQAYVDASWCLPKRQTEIGWIANKRLKELGKAAPDRKTAAAGGA